MQEITNGNLETKTKTELLEIAKSLNVKGRSLLNKDKLIVAIITAYQEQQRKTEILVSSTKVSPEINESSSSPMPEKKVHLEVPTGDIPHRYNKDVLTLMVRDPYWGFTYWEISDQTAEQYTLDRETLAMRVYDITDINFDGTNAHRYIHIHVGQANQWYIDFGSANRSYVAEVGYVNQFGEFIRILQSNMVITPRDKVSDNIDEKYMISDEDFERIFHLSGGMIPQLSSQEMIEAGERRWQLTNQMSSENVSSFSLSSMNLSSQFR